MYLKNLARSVGVYVKQSGMHLVLGLLALSLAFALGAINYHLGRWPFDSNQERAAKAARIAELYEIAHGPKFDRYGRLVRKPGMTEVICPVQGQRTAVMLSIGQSNVANSGAYMNHSGYGERIVNLFDGKCYAAASPLLGAGGSSGEWITLLANKLVEKKAFDNVIIISSGIGSSTISRWQKGGDLNRMLLNVLGQATQQYEINFILWHQGESDFLENTDPHAYESGFSSMVESIRHAGVSAPVFASIATKCGHDGWYSENDIARAQRHLANARQSIFIGVDSDHLLSDWDRSDADNCHFSGTGQEKVATEIASEIARHFGHHKSGPSTLINEHRQHPVPASPPGRSVQLKARTGGTAS